MDRNSVFFKQAQLMMRVMPFVEKEACFALKGQKTGFGTPDRNRSKTPPPQHNGPKSPYLSRHCGNDLTGVNISS